MSSSKIIESTGSTQADLKDWLAREEVLPHLSWVQARSQTDGRGRQGHEWISPSGNLYLSVLYRLAGETSEAAAVRANLTWFPLWVGVQVRAALVEQGVPSADLQVKWPNDLYARGTHKLGGVLCERLSVGEGQHALVVGIGLNVANSPSIEQRGERRTVISLQEIFGEKAIADFTLTVEPRSLPTVDTIRDGVLSALARPFDRGLLRADLAQHLIPRPGASIEWSDRDRTSQSTGVVQGLGEFGELQVTTNGERVSLFSEEVKIRGFG